MKYLYNPITGQIKETTLMPHTSPTFGNWVLLELTQEQLDSFIKQGIVHFA